MTIKTHSQKQARHDAFLIRKGIFFVGVPVGLLFGYFLSDWVLGLASYFVAVTVADAVVHYGLGKRSSVFVSQKNLATNEQISPVDLDRYHDSRRNVRFVALAAAGLSLIVLPLPEVFCGVYIAVSIVAVLYTKFALKIAGPVWIRRDDRHLNLHKNSGQREMKHFFDDCDQGRLGSGIYSRLSE